MATAAAHCLAARAAAWLWKQGEQGGAGAGARGAHRRVVDVRTSQRALVVVVVVVVVVLYAHKVAGREAQGP